MKKKYAHQPELSRPLAVDKVSQGGIEETIVATPLELKQLTQRFGLLELSSLKAVLNVDHAQGGLLSVTGRLSAEVVQQCVVTLEPVPAHVVDTIDVLFGPARLLDPGAGATSGFEPGEDEAPEPFENGMIDLGELVAQHLAVALDPYPRKPGAQLPEVAVATAGKDVEKANPFAVLADLAAKKDL